MAATSVEKIIQEQLYSMLAANLTTIQGREIYVWYNGMDETYRQDYPRVVITFPEQQSEELLDRQMKLVRYRVTIELTDSDRDPDRARETLALLSALVQQVCYAFPQLYLAGLYVLDESCFRFDTSGTEQFGNAEITRNLDLYITTVVELGTVYDSSF